MQVVGPTGALADERPAVVARFGRRLGREAELRPALRRHVRTRTRRLAGGDACGAVEDLGDGFAATRQLLADLHDRSGGLDHRRRSDEDTSPVGAVHGGHDVSVTTLGDLDADLLGHDTLREHADYLRTNQSTIHILIIKVNRK